MYHLHFSRIHQFISIMVLLSLLLNSSLIAFVPRQTYAQEGVKVDVTGDELVTVDDKVQAIPVVEDSSAPVISTLRSEEPEMARLRDEALALPNAATTNAFKWPQVTVEQPKALESMIDAFPNELPPERTDARIFQDAAKQQNQRGMTSLAQTATTPQIALSLAYIFFFAPEDGDNPASQSLEVSNAGVGTLNFTLAETIPWLTLSANSGTVTTDTATIDMTVDTTSLTTASPYTALITVTNSADSDDSQLVWVRLSLDTSQGYNSLSMYDANGNLQRSIDANGAEVDYKYNTLNQLTAIRYPDGTSASYEYDENGNRIAMTDNWGTIQYVYDDANRLTAVYYPNLNPIEGAIVNLYRVPDALPDKDGQVNDCRTTETRPSGPTGDWSGVPAATLDDGVWVNPDLFTIGATQEISPTINPQITGNDGRYAWDVAEGCWYVVVEAEGYPTTVSPLVGVPPEVTDLDIVLSSENSGALYLPLVVRGN